MSGPLLAGILRLMPPEQESARFYRKALINRALTCHRQAGGLATGRWAGCRPAGDWLDGWLEGWPDSWLDGRRGPAGPG
jgi:hypothetical protein